MCGRFTHTLTWSEIVALYRLTQPDPPLGWRARYNLAPTQDAPVVRVSPETGNRELVMLRWGLVPPWLEEPKSGYSMINARAETVVTKPAFRSAFRRRRCIVPACGFYEWRAEGKGPKQPYRFRRHDGQPLSLAGLWERWQKGDAEAVESFTIIVGEANEQVRPFHDRMPVILEPEHFDVWLDPQMDVRLLEPLLSPFGSELVIEPVSRAVNSPANDYPELLLVAAADGDAAEMS